MKDSLKFTLWLALAGAWLFVYPALNSAYPKSGEPQRITVVENGFGYEVETTSGTVGDLVSSLSQGGQSVLSMPAAATPLTTGWTLALKNPKPVASKFVLKKEEVRVASLEAKKPTFSGLATWYSIPTGLTAASREFKRGTRLLVTNPQNGKSVEVTINDYGPKAYTRVALDLNQPAFAAIAPLSAGKVRVLYQAI